MLDDRTLYWKGHEFMANDTLGGAKTLLDVFFHEQDQHLLNAFRERLERTDRRTQLAQVSGIHDEAVLDRLIELDIGPETLAAMAVVPLICVAWADGKVQEIERQAILAAAQAAGVQPQNGRYPLLEYWLNERPDAELLEAWEHYIQHLCQRLDEHEIGELRRDLLDRARCGRSGRGNARVREQDFRRKCAMLDSNKLR